MDATVKQMIDGYRMGVDSQAGMISDRNGLSDMVFPPCPVPSIAPTLYARLVKG